MANFLFTDIEDSTRRWDEFPGAMADARRRHSDILIRSINAVGGTLVKDTGDGIFAAFDTQSSALDCAIDAQRRLIAEDFSAVGGLPVRMGLHSGSVEMSSDGDYHGSVVNEAARVMDAGHGGQILASAAFADGVVHEAVDFLSLGHHRLKGLRDTMEIVQVVAADLPSAFPELRTPDGMPNNLPAAATEFVGRRVELAELADLSRTKRLTTLVGPGGSGKTRLALEVGRTHIATTPGGVWFVDLARVDDPRLVPEAAAATLKLLDRIGQTWTESVLAHLADRAAVLIFDNCEHVIDAAAEVIEAIIARCPAVTIIATSRESVGVAGEASWPVRSLGLPHADADPDDALDSEAVRFFISRVQAVNAQLTLADIDVESAVHICRRLDGLPLALELAASRVRTMPLNEIARHLDDRFRLLVGGSRTALPRQRTLEATVEWSYRLLEDDEKRAFAELSVFNGSFSLESAAKVCPHAGWDVVTRLAERSLIELQPSATARYRMLETLRAFGRAQLADAGEMEASRDRLLVWALALSNEAADELDGERQAEWLETIETELVNIRSALDWAHETGALVEGLRMAANLYRYWFSRRIPEGRDWLERFLSGATRLPDDDEAVAMANLAISPLLQAQGEDQSGLDAAFAAMRAFESTGDRSRAAWADYYAARCLMGQGRNEEAWDVVTRTHAEFVDLGDAFGQVMSLFFVVGLGDRLGMHNDVEVEAVIAALDVFSGESAPPTIRAHVAETVWAVRARRSRFDVNSERLAEALRLYEGLDNRMCVVHCLENTVYFAMNSARPDRLNSRDDAVRLLGKVRAIREGSGVVVPPWERVFTDEIDRIVRERWAKADAERLLEEGSEFSFEEAIEFAIGMVDGEPAPG